MSGISQACESFLTKWQTAFEDVGVDVQDTNWEDLMGNQQYGIAVLVAANSGGYVPTTADAVAAAVGAIFRSRNYDEVLDPNEANLLLGLFGKLTVPIPNTVPINCASLVAIASTPAAELPAVLATLDQGSDSDSDDDEDNGSGSESPPAPAVSLPPPPGGFNPTGVYTPAPAVNPFMLPTGTLNAPNPTFPAPAQPAFPAVGTNPPAAFPALNQPPTMGTFMPPPGQQTSMLPQQQFPLPGQQATGVVGGQMLPPATGGFQMPPPGVGQLQLQQTQQPAQPEKDLSYTAVAVHGLRTTNQSKLILVKIPYVDSPNDFITIEIFMTVGPAPRTVSVTKFSDDDFDKADNGQKRVIHTQNGKTLNTNPISTQLSNGVSETGVCAQTVESYLASPIVKDAASGQDMPFPIPLENCKPESGKVKSINQIASGGYSVPITSQTSGGQPMAQTSGGMQAPAGQQTVVEGPQDEPIAANAVRVQAFTFGPNPHLLPLINTYQLPNAPRLMAIGDGWYWYDLPNGKIGRAKTKFAPAGFKFDTRPGVKQQATYNAIRVLAAQRFGPNYAQPGSGGTAATGHTFAAPRPMTIVGQPLAAPAGSLGLMMGQQPMGTFQPGGFQAAQQPGSVMYPLAQQSQLQQPPQPGQSQMYQFPQQQSGLTLPQPGTGYQAGVPTYAAPQTGQLLTLADLLRTQAPVNPIPTQQQQGVLQQSTVVPSQMGQLAGALQTAQAVQQQQFPVPQQQTQQQFQQAPQQQFPAQQMGTGALQTTQVVQQQFPVPTQQFQQQMQTGALQTAQPVQQQTLQQFPAPTQQQFQQVPQQQPGAQQQTPLGGATALPDNPGIQAINVNQPYVQNVQVPATQVATYVPLPPPPGV